MARGFGKLTVKKVEHLSRRGMHADGGGLYLQVAEGGSKNWLFRYKLHGRTHWHGMAWHGIGMAWLGFAERHTGGAQAQPGGVQPSAGGRGMICAHGKSSAASAHGT